MRRRALWALAGVFLLAYSWTAVDAARRLSPAWDEACFPSSGLAQWRTGAIRFDAAAPFLPKLLMAAPLLLTKAELPVGHPSWAARDAYRFGFQFLFRNRLPAQRLLLLSRCVAVLFSVLTGMLIFFWLKSLWGWPGAFAAAGAYAAVPVFLSRTSLALSEAPLYFFMVLALWCHGRWRSAGRPVWLAAAGGVAGAAFLCKMAAMPLLPTLFLLEFLLPPTGQGWGRRFANVAILGISCVAVVLAGYLPWDGGAESLAAVLRHTLHFETLLPFYWRGQTLAAAPSLISWAAVGVKAPLAVLLLGLWGAVAWGMSHRAPVDFWRFFLFAGICLGQVLFLDNAVSTVQLSPFYLGVAGLAGGVGARFRSCPRWTAAGAAALLGAAGWSALRVHPNYLAYFNGLAGGPENGHRWLADSDQDWGQSLPSLARYLRSQGSPPLILSYSGAADPSAYGLRYQDLVSPALVSRERAEVLLPLDAAPVALAVGTKLLQSEPSLFGWLRQNRTPKTVVDSCVFVYDITDDPEAFRWMGHVYLATGRPAPAAWAFRRARRLDPGNPEDDAVLDRLQAGPPASQKPRQRNRS